MQETSRQKDQQVKRKPECEYDSRTDPRYGQCSDRRLLIDTLQRACIGLQRGSGGFNEEVGFEHGLEVSPRKTNRSVRWRTQHCVDPYAVARRVRRVHRGAGGGATVQTI